jgi:hypothetical protein
MPHVLSRRRAALAVAAAVTLLTALFVVTSRSPADAALVLVSQGKPATASTTENAASPASAAVDGNPGTRWSSAFADPQWIQVDLGTTTQVAQVTLQWEAAYARAFQLQVAASASGPWTTIYSTTTGTGGTQALSVTGSGRYVRMNGTARGTAYGYSLWEFQVYGLIDTGSGCSGNAALNRPSAASTVENATMPASAAFDGNGATRWSSAFADPQWIRVDLGSATAIGRVKLSWEAAYSSAYQIQTSNDGTTWTTVKTVTGADGGVDEHTGLGANGRYLRIYGTARGTGYGHSLWEVEAYTS